MDEHSVRADNVLNTAVAFQRHVIKKCDVFLAFMESKVHPVIIKPHFNH